MGLIRAAIGSAAGAAADTWKEAFSCSAMPADVLMVRGVKQSSGYSTNKFGHDNIITNGSVIMVADGQAAAIVDNGEIVEFTAETGTFTYDSSSEPSIFCGDLKQGIKDTFAVMKKRFTFGGDTGKDQRVYFFNTKEMLGNKFGTMNPVPFRIVDANVNLDFDAQIRCSGTYSFRIADPMLFYKNVAGNVEREYTYDMIATQMKTEFISALQPAFGKLSDMGLRPSQLTAHTEELCQFINEALDEKWVKLRGIEVVEVAMNPITLTEEDQALLRTAQKAGMSKNIEMAAAIRNEAETEALKAAASNTAGAMTGFMGMEMAMNQAGGAQQMYQMAAAQNAQQPQQAAPAAGGWTCSCGSVNQGNFCPNCGSQKPAAPAAKFCPNCGTKLEGAKFCSNCGTKLD